MTKLQSARCRTTLDTLSVCSLGPHSSMHSRALERHVGRPRRDCRGNHALCPLPRRSAWLAGSMCPPLLSFRRSPQSPTPFHESPATAVRLQTNGGSESALAASAPPGCVFALAATPMAHSMIMPHSMSMPHSMDYASLHAHAHSMITPGPAVGATRRQPRGRALWHAQQALEAQMIGSEVEFELGILTP